MIFVVILFVLAVTDLVVGVSNDAVNFLNSSIGSKAAPFKVILAVAALGVLIGAVFSSGMMEVARKGIFHPEQYYFNEIMVLFLAVMMTDILLLDLFNTYALPTSTTVSIVFELLGAAVAVAFIKMSASGDEAGTLATYINSSSALGIISGILLSIIIAFSVGAIVQYISRIIFSFNYHQSFKYFGTVWGGMAITAITYFILLKGLKGSAFAGYELDNGLTLSDWVKQSAFIIIVYSFVGWTLILLVMHWIFRVNILKFIVLVGTFALAMAFAGNDLVNFIGVPLAGFESYKAFIASGAEAGSFSMDVLAGKVQTPPVFLVIAGFVMVVTLWFSRKAKSVAATTIDLSRQDEGSERFESFYIARVIVRRFIAVGNLFKVILPPKARKWINSRFERDSYDKMKQEKGVSFDLIRASVNLMVASILISIATSMKLPLSTTYVTFMVAMGTSLADRAWGRESAVYRISGVVTVITGWCFTAIMAFTAAFVMAYVIYYGGMVAIFALIAAAGFFFYRTKIIHKKREEESEKKESLAAETSPIDIENVFEYCSTTLVDYLQKTMTLYNRIAQSLVEEDLKNARKTKKKIDALNSEIKEIKSNIHVIIKRLREEDIDSGHYYVQVIDYLRETAHSLRFLIEPVYVHIDNNHPPLAEDQANGLKDIKEKISAMLKEIIAIISQNAYHETDKVIEMQQAILNDIQKLRKKLLKSLKKEGLSTKSSMLYLEILSESKNLCLYIVNVLKAQRDFVLFKAQNHHE